MHQCLVSAFPWMIITCFIFTLAAQSAGDNGDPFTDEISINCGSTGPSVSLDGRTWTGDFCSNLTIQGSSIRSTVTREPVSFAEPVLYKTARISSSRFSYIFRLDSGQKLIRLHFNPTSYNGFEMSQDLFTVRAGSFTLLSNFSASITANALGVNFLIKEFCIILEQNCLLNVTFSPVTVTCQSRDTHAFINAIQVISVPESLSYTGEKIPLIGEKFPVYINNSTALEMVHRQSVKRDCVTPGDDFRGMFGMSNEQVKNITWRISVDIGFRYLVRFHFSELGLRMAENGNNSFALVINHMVAYTNARVPGQKEDQSDEHGIVYRNYMVMAKGCKQEGKRDIFISLQPKNEFLYGHGPLQGFEIFKLSNHDNSLGSPNPSPTEQGPFWTFRHTFSVLGNRNTVATAAIMIICLVNVIVHMLRQTWEVYFPEEEKKPTTRVSRICRCFSLTEIQAATENFNDSFVVGKGGFGKVYKGFIGYNREIVAIKRKKTDSKQGNREFWTEVETLSELRHVNLVSLIGYCNDEQEMILVYEYMPNGTLADHLYKLARKKSKFTSLSWEERLQICIGAGRGLDYLHTGKGVIHRDIKASNILLDENFVAKVSDFGLAKTECSSGLQNKDSTHIKGTFGYIDPEYFKTRKLTTRSDTYAFGVVLLEVLCGRPAVDPLAAEDERSLTIWALDNIRRGRVDQILAPCVSDGISPDSLKTFLKIVESCLHDEPNKRPPIVHAVISLEFSLELQKKKPSLSNDIASFADLLPFTNRTQQENANLLVVNEMTEAADIVQRDNRAQSENATSLLPNEITCVADILPRTDRASRSTMQLTMASSHMQSMTCLMKEETDSRMVNAEPPNGKKDGQKYLISKLSRLFSWVSVWKGATPSKRTRFAGIPKSAPIAKNSKKEQTSCRIVDTEPPDGKRDARKSVMYKLSRFFPWHSVREEKPYKRKDFAGISISAPLTKYFSNKTSLRSSTAYQKTELAEGGKDDMILSHNFRIYSFSELKVATRNFRPDSVLGEGGFGRVFKGFLQEKSTNTDKVGSIIAVKKLNHESWQGFKEWLAEINFLGKLSHRNIVKLLGYCLEDRELLLVYEFMQKGSLENHLFRRNHAVEPLSWQLRLKILIGAACGLAYLHSLDTPVILRDFKTSNILLDGSYNAKLSDLGLARLSASVDHSHVSTRVVGTYGYAAPEYVATGHLYVKSDVYGFGVVMLEILTGMRALDRNRPYGQHSLVDWIMPMHKRSVKRIIDVRLEGRYPSKSAMQVYQLAKSCLNADVKSRPSMEEVIVKLEAASVKVLEGVSYQVKNTSP